MPQAVPTAPIRAGHDHWINEGASGHSTGARQPCLMPETGDRIELVEMPDDPCPMLPGSRGTVTAVVPEADQIRVDWDCGSRLHLVVGADSWIVLPKDS